MNVSGQEVATGFADPSVMITTVAIIFGVIFVALIGYALWKAMT